MRARHAAAAALLALAATLGDAGVGTAQSPPTSTPYTAVPRIRNRSEVVEATRRHYPPALRRRGVGGEVTITGVVTERGTVEKALVVRGSGHAALDSAALEVVKTMRWSPALRGLTPVPAAVQFPIVFRPAG